MKKSMTMIGAITMVVAHAAWAQSTLDERIKTAQQAQAEREAVEARKRQEAQAPSSPPPGAPRIDLSGVRPAQVPAGNGQASVPVPDQFELIQIKGFMDEPASMEALVFYNGNRHALTSQQKRLPGGWELVSIGPEAVDISKGNERRQLRFVQYFRPAGAPGSASAQSQQARP